MISKAQIKSINALKQKKKRDEQGLFIAEGVKVVNEILNSGIRVRQIISSRNFQLNIFNYEIEVLRIRESELKKISSLSTPNEVLAVCEIPKYELRMEQLKGKLSLVLDTIQDPGNLGTIVRIADWFGIEHIICSEDTVDVYNPKVIQATMGSIARVKVHYSDLGIVLSKAKETIPGIKIYGAALDGKNIYENGSLGDGLLIMGNESKGISEPVLQHVTDRILIPNYGGGAESLNVAIATAVIAAEFKRRA